MKITSLTLCLQHFDKFSISRGQKFIFTYLISILCYHGINGTFDQRRPDFSLSVTRIYCQHGNIAAFDHFFVKVKFTNDCTHTFSIYTSLERFRVKINNYRSIFFRLPFLISFKGGLISGFSLCLKSPKNDAKSLIIMSISSCRWIAFFLLSQS